VVERLKAIGLSERRACRLAHAARSSVRHRSRRRQETALRQRLRDLAGRHTRFGHPRLHIPLLRERSPFRASQHNILPGNGANHKKANRIYCEEKLQVRKRKPKRRMAVMRQPMTVPNRINMRRGANFLQDQLSNGRRIWGLNVIDNNSHQCLASFVDTSISVVQVQAFFCPELAYTRLIRKRSAKRIGYRDMKMQSLKH